MGRNGAGKSTTMKAIMGLIGQRPGARSIFSNERYRRACSAFEVARRGLGFTPEDRRIFSDLDGAGKSRCRPPAGRASCPTASRRRCGRRSGCSRCFPISAEMPNRPGGRMSGGEQQMLTVARTLMGNPLRVLLDEPSEGVAPLIVEQMANTIIELKKEGPVDSAVGAERPLRAIGVGPGLRAGKGSGALAGQHGGAFRQPGHSAQLFDDVRNVQMGLPAIRIPGHDLPNW